MLAGLPQLGRNFWKKASDGGGKLFDIKTGFLKKGEKGL
jgi:hypothetical protein